MTLQPLSIQLARRTVILLRRGGTGISEPITRTNLETFGVPASKYETVMMLVEIAPHLNSGLHTHPRFDAAYLLEGDLTVVALAIRTRRSIRVNRGTSRPASSRR